MAGPGEETTAPATSPDRDENGLPPSRVTPEMSDGDIKATLRDAYLKNGEWFATVLQSEPQFQNKDLADLKEVLRQSWPVRDTDPAWKARFEGLQQEVIEEVAPRLYAGVSTDAQYSITNSTGRSPTNPNVAGAGDPVRLFDGDFRYSTVDFQLDGAGFDLVFARTYSQLTSYSGPMGAKWDHSYNLWIRVDDGAAHLHRSNGALAEEDFTRHEVFGYWVPPPGVHGAIVEENDSLVFLRSDGSRIVYEHQAGVAETTFLATVIADRFGNQLELSYTDGLLARILVNHRERMVELAYDDQRRIVAAQDHTDRTWTYHYDAEADLLGMTVPGTPAHPRGCTTRYEYANLSLGPPDLAHHLTAIVDADGRAYLENVYGSARGLLSYGRVVSQRQGGGQIELDYSDVVESYDLPYAEHERPSCQTVITERDGHLRRHLFNARGNMLIQEEVGRVDGLPARLTSHYRYNQDGNLVGVMSPLGTLTQGLWGRDSYERRFPVPAGTTPAQDANLTLRRRLAFGNLLTVVKRGAPHDIGRLLIAAGLWAQDVFPDVLVADDADVIQKFTYEPMAGQLSSTSDPRVTRFADPDAAEDAEYQRRLTTYTYQGAAATLTAIDLPTPRLPDGSPGAAPRLRFGPYDDHGRILETTAPNGLRTVNKYAPDGTGPRAGFLVGHIFDPGGLELRHTFEVDALGRTVAVSRPSATGDGRFTSTVTFDNRNQLVESVSTRPRSVRSRHSYDRTGNLTRSELELTAADGSSSGLLVTANRYDAEGHVERQRIGDAADDLSKTRRIKHDLAGRPVVLLSPGGRVGLLRYDERSQVSKVIHDAGGVHAVTRRAYDADGRLTRLVSPRGAVTRYRYDALGRNVETEDAEGNRLVRHFDKLGQPVVECLFERAGDDSFVLVHRRELGYDELGQLITVGTTRFTTPLTVGGDDVATAFRDAGPGRPLRLEYFRDSLGNIVKEVDQDGREFHIRFDVLGRLTERSDPVGNLVRLTYDREGNIERVDRREVTVDAASGQVVSEQWFAEAFGFDELDRIIAHRTVTGTTHFQHDSRGLVTAVTDRSGNRTEHDYDVFGRTVASRVPLVPEGSGGSPVPLETSYTYNLDDQVLSCRDALGRTTSFEYDSNGRLERTLFANGSADQYQYDDVGNVTAYVDPNGARRDLTWDLLDRNTDVVVALADLPAGVEVPGASSTHFEYDALHRITVASNDFATIRIEYDSLLAERETVSFAPGTGLDSTATHVLSRVCSDTGAVTSVSYPSGRRLQFGRDMLDRVVKVAQIRRGADYPGDPATPDELDLVTVDYQGLRPATLSRGNGLTTGYTYDFGGRAVEVKHEAPGQLILRQQQLGDADGLVRQRGEERAGQPGQATIRRFGYDSLHRLATVLEGTAPALADLSALGAPSTPVPDPVPDRQAEIDALISIANAPRASYTYDSVGNRLSSTSPSGNHVYVPSALDQYDSIDHIPLSHDRNGNRTGDSRFLYGFDYRNQLVRVTEAVTGDRTEFLRDAFGRVCVERSAGSLRGLLYDGRQVVEEITPAGFDRSLVCVDRGDQYALVSGGGSERHLLSDLTRSVRATHDLSSVRAIYDYDEFGQLLSAPVPDANPVFFAGGRLAGDTGCYEFGWRTYDPALGRFLQRDPRGSVDGTNLYAYARNDPLGRSDPTGTESRQEHPEVATKLGAELAYRNPEGFTKAVPNNFDRAKIKAYRERIQDPLDRGIGIRSRPPGMRTATDDIRRRTKGMRDQYEASLPGGRRRPGTDIDHTVELQDIIRPRPDQFAPGADRVRPVDHRELDSGLNRSQGSSGRHVKDRQVLAVAPLDTSAGGVARERDLNKLWNRQGYRTGMRAFGRYNLFGGTFADLTSVRDSVAEGDFAAAGVSTSSFVGGALEIGGMAARSSTLLGWGRWLGAPGAVVSSGAIGVRIGTNLYENYVDHEMMLDAGSWVEEATGSRVLGAAAAAYVATMDAAMHAPEAAFDYVRDNITIDPDEIDWDRTLKPWKWI